MNPVKARGSKIATEPWVHRHTAVEELRACCTIEGTFFQELAQAHRFVVPLPGLVPCSGVDNPCGCCKAPEVGLFHVLPAD